jgi:hypothetical protein
MKQTAVEWLVEQLKEYDFADIKDQENYIIKIQSWVLAEKIEQAKEMEKEQIKNAYYTGGDDVEDNRDREAEKYYNETYIANRDKQ